MQAPSQHLFPVAAHTFHHALPDKIKQATMTYAEAMEYPVEVVLAIVLVRCLDPDALRFADCQPMTRQERDFGR